MRFTDPRIHQLFLRIEKWSYTILLIFVIIIMTNEMACANRYYFERPKLGAGFSYEYDSEQESNVHDTETKDIEYSFRESLNIATKGWLYHPALIKFRLEIEPIWKQVTRKTDSNAGTSRKTFLQSYFLDMTILERKPYVLNLFTRKNYTTLKSSQSHTSETESALYGATLLLKYSLLPTRLNYVHSSSIQTGIFSYEEDTDRFNLFTRHASEKSDTRLKTSYMLRERTSTNTKIETKSSESSILNTYNFSGDNKIQLNSSLFHGWSDSGSAIRNNYGFMESLRLRHRRNLSSDYNISFSENSSGDFVSTVATANTGVTHQLYENLTTSLNLNASTNNFSGGSSDDYNGGINFAYTRSIPWGSINLNTGQSYGITMNEHAANNLQIIDEHHVMSAGDITMLDNENIDTGSIVVTDITGSITYIIDVDYNISGTGPNTWLSLTALSSISDGEEVIVSYSFVSNPAYDFSTYNLSYGASLSLWSILNISYSSYRSEHKFLSGIEPLKMPDNEQEIMGAGIFYKWRFTKTKLLYEIINSTSSSRSRALAEEKITFRATDRIFIEPSAFYSHVEFRDTNEKEETVRIMTALQWRITRRISLGIGGFWNKVSGRAESMGAGFSPSLHWTLGGWQADMNYKFSNEKSGNNDRNFINHYLKFELKRSLF